MKKQQQTTSFGYRDVPVQDKQGLVRDVFDKVADKYDIMNDVMSGGLHRLWKAHMVAALSLPRHEKPYQLLDVAGGTGDIAFRARGQAGAGFQAHCLDINEEMLRVGQAKAVQKGLDDSVNFITGNAEELPFTDDYFDAYTIAFGIRNVTYRDKALAEAYRVLKPGGRFLCLEFSHVTMPALDKLYDSWSFHVIPKLGKLIAGDGDPYSYLVESIRKFPKPDAFATELQAAGFARVRYERLSAGIAALHSGWKI
ncbi:MAG: bifunctional demethylmenaquinone methyltransferase/2-methoxy-6-polyprenyl-1,4-benzoquinol methylase UbiE [Parvibaculales bacterium]